jgi:hypothetical protein
MSKIKHLLAFLLIASLYQPAFSQNEEQDSIHKCSVLINRMSYYWKLDSLANNGFRLYAYKDLLKCKVDKLTRAFLLEKFGKPNTIRKTNHGTEYLYYFYDSKAMPEKFGRAFEAGYISFLFGEYDKHLTSIEEGTIDY